jgi:hypothetical protein
MPGFDFPQLDERTRVLMVKEFALDDSSPKGVYRGRRLNSEGERIYLSALLVSLQEGTGISLQAQLEPVPGTLWVPEIINKIGRRSPTPYTAAQTLAEGEFNRYYMRAICRRALEEGDGTVTVRRAKLVEQSRPDDEVRVSVGDILDADAVLQDIRLHPGEDTALGMPRGPNSGLSLEFLPPTAK